MSTGRNRRELRRWPAIIAIPLLAFIALVCWGFASPIGSSPDDGFHLASAWCGGGLDAECKQGASDAERSVSVDLVEAPSCYAFQAEQSADCQRDGFGDDVSKNLDSTTTGNFEDLYPPVYYFVMSPFAGDNLQVSALTMRMINSLLFVGVVTALFWLLPVSRRPTLLVAMVVCVVPLGMFLIPSNNPSSWAILSAGTFWIALLGFFETHGRRRVALGGIAALTAVIGAGARADSALYVLLSIAVVFILTVRLNVRFLLLCLLPLAIAVIAVVLFLSSQQVASASTGLEPNLVKPEYSQYTLTVGNLLQIPDLWAGVFGTWSLGWLDTEMPAVVWFSGICVFGAIVLLGFGSNRTAVDRRKVLAGVLVLVMLLAIPAVILYRSEIIVGFSVQPRYVFPMIILLAGVALLRSRGDALRLSTVQLVLLAGAVSIANAAALHTNLRRYVTGIDGTWGNLDLGIEWWWNIAVSPMWMWAIGSLSFAVVLFWLGHLSRSRTEPVDGLNRTVDLERTSIPA
ncbi:MAG: hypothetical protein JWM50_113 [Microbacteriaceae bacterium]|jgi:hypothetical protein|nr:hypothetical protein [Microbacteriaceae bacterium]